MLKICLIHLLTNRGILIACLHKIRLFTYEIEIAKLRQQISEWFTCIKYIRNVTRYRIKLFILSSYLLYYIVGNENWIRSEPDKRKHSTSFPLLNTKETNIIHSRTQRINEPGSHLTSPPRCNDVSSRTTHNEILAEQKLGYRARNIWNRK